LEGSASLQPFAEQAQLLLFRLERNMLGKERLYNFLLLHKLSPQLLVQMQGCPQIQPLRVTLRLVQKASQLRDLIPHLLLQPIELAEAVGIRP
jgi:hypothetical protein